jgi:tetratricopeptide (TPR) repeat protein
LEKAGENAFSEGAYQEAIKFLSEALTLVDGQLLAGQPSVSALRRARWMFGLGESHRVVGQMVQSRGYLEQSVVVFDRPIPATNGQRVFGLISQIALQTCHRLWPTWFVGRASAEERDRLLQAARNYQGLTGLYIISGEQILGLYVALRIINVTERVGQSAELAIAYGIMGLLSGLVGLHSLAESYLRQGLEMAQGLEQLAVLPQVLTASALYRVGVGQWVKAKEEITQALEIYLQFGSWRMWIDAIGILGVAERYLGQYKVSQKIFADVYATRDRYGDLAAMLGSTGQGGIALLLGETEAAIEFLEQARSLSSERVSEIISNYGDLAAAYLRRGDVSAAEEVADRAAKLIAKNSPPSLFSVLGGYTNVAQVYLALWEMDPQSNNQVKDRAHRICQALWTYTRVFPIGEPSALLAQGLYDWLSGQPGRAQQAWHKSLAVAQKLSMAYEAGQAYYEIGRHTQGAERHTYLTQALSHFEKLGAAYEVKRTRALLNALKR